MQRRLVREETVRQLAVVAQPFPVVAGDDHQRGPAGSVPGGIEQWAEREVGEGHLAGVRRVGVLPVVRGRRLVRGMRVEHVYPREPA